MPRRPPPTSLRLVQGPVPSQSTPKHTLPSVPRPAFHPQAALERVSPMCTNRGNFGHQRRPELSVSIPYGQVGRVEGSPLSAMSGPSGGGKKLRGPWDHSGSIRVPFDTEMLLTPLKPAVVSPGGGWRGQ